MRLLFQNSRSAGRDHDLISRESPHRERCGDGPAERPAATAKGSPRLRRALAATAALAVAVGAGTLAPAASAAPPTVQAPTLGSATETSAAVQAQFNPNLREVKDAHFEAISEADYQADGNDFGAGTIATAPQAFPAGSEPIAVKATLAGLSASTTYRLRLHVKSTGGETAGPETVFHTLAGAPAYGPCPNEAFRSGQYAPLGEPSAALPDCRAYERATPADKNGGDAVGSYPFVKAAATGAGITFGSTFGMPGAEGAQTLPTFAALRSGAGTWSTYGQLPPATAGEKAYVVGWLADLSASFATATRLDTPKTEALWEMHPNGAPPTQLTPYVSDSGFDALRGNFAYAGASEDGSTVIFESTAALAPEAVEGSSNVYAWQRESGAISLVSVLNEAEESEEALPKGAFAGPYDWAKADPNRGGAAHQYYTQDTRAVAADGKAVFFTAAGSGQLYERLNPTMPQSHTDGEGNCEEPQKACTLHVSATEKENGESESGADPAGPQPAALQAASKDGSVAYFTSPEKLTDDANTGPEQPEATISADTLDGSPANLVLRFLKRHAVGVAVYEDHIYWADPAEGTIGRARIEAGNAVDIKDDYIEPGPTEYEGEEVPSTPRYVAADKEHVYWTNTGPLDEEQRPIEGAGTIGRAEIDPITEDATEVEPECVKGAFNPQGIAVNATHIYWANAASDTKSFKSAVARATIDCKEANQNFARAPIIQGTSIVYGVALDETYVYFSSDAGNGGYVDRAPLGGGTSEGLFVGTAGVRGVAIEAGNLYWANQGEEAIGEIPTAAYAVGSCGSIPSCQEQLISLTGEPAGLAADSTNLHWSLNGEAPSNPGNDLYRFSVSADGEGHHLTDLSAEGTSEDGAEAQGVAGVSADGARAYFIANGDLDGEGPAEAGDCHRSSAKSFASLAGQCSLYRWEGGQASLVARLDASGGQTKTDAVDWLPTPFEVFGNSAIPKGSEASADGATLLFRSQRKLTPYDNHGVAELYRYRVGAEPAIACVTCNPTGAPPGEEAVSLGTIVYPGSGPREGALAMTQTRFLAAAGDRVFFETTERLVGPDTNGIGGCPPAGSPAQAGQGFKACTDVYEWEAPSTPGGSCSEASASYSPQDEGCLYLISTGKSDEPSFFADASRSGEDVFLFTRERLIGADTDALVDVYDARVGGGVASQNPQPVVECEGEACKGPLTPAPALQGPATPNFAGPGNPKPKRRCPKGKVARRVKGKKGRKGRVRCVKRRRAHRKRHHRHRRRRHHQGRARR